MKCDRREFIVAVGAGAVAACSRGSCNAGQPGGSASIAPPAPGYFVRLTGLLGTSVSGSTPRLDVFLVDGQQTLQRTHQPFLIIPTGVVTGGAATKDDQKIVDGVDSLFWKLDGYQVNFDGVSSGSGANALLNAGVTPIKNHRHPNTSKPDPRTNPATPTADEDDATWIAELTKVPNVPPVGNAPVGAIHASCRATDPRPAKIAARAHFSAGNLAGRFTSRWRDKTFRIGTGNYTQALSLAEVRIPRAYTSLTISLLPFDSSSTLPPKTLTVTRGATDVIMDLANEPTSMMVTCTNDDMLRKLDHFRAYYQLLDPTSTTISGPIPECVGSNCPGCSSIGGATMDETQVVYCPPAAYI